MMMETKQIVSPLALWKDYDPTATDLDVSIVARYVDNGIRVKTFYFNGLESVDGTARVFGALVYDSTAYEDNNGFLPVVLLTADIYSSDTKDAAHFLANAGYAVMLYDFRSEMSAERCTFYPDSLSYARYESSRDTLYMVSSTAKETPWYVWTVSARRALTLIREEFEELDASRTAVVGLREGGSIALMLSAIDDRLSTAVNLGDTGWKDYGLLYDSNKGEQLSLFDDDRARYHYSLGAESYAQFVKKPLLLAFGTNDVRNNFDRAFDTYARLPATLKCAMSVSPRADGGVRCDQFKDMVKWLDALLRFEGVYPQTPQIEMYGSDGRLYVKLKADMVTEISTATVYYAYNEPDYRIRNWHTIKADQLGAGEWIARPEVGDASKYAFCFGIVQYQNGVSVASKMAAKIPSEEGVQGAGFKPSRLIYDSAMGLDCFTVVNTDSLFHTVQEVQMREGPFKILGIRANVGSLATFKLSDPKWYGYDEDNLTLTYYSRADATVSVSVESFANGAWSAPYRAVIRAGGGELWQKVTLGLSDFKSAAGDVLASWEYAQKLYFTAEGGDEFLISSLLWS